MKAVFPSVIVFLLLGCTAPAPVCTNPKHVTNLNEDNALGIVRNLPPADYSRIGDNLHVFPEFYKEPYDIDVRSADLRQFDLSGRKDELFHSTFDSKTVWPGLLPEWFDPEKVMELGKNPGLSVRALHSKGINGDGIGIAVIDTGLLVDHVEYKDRLRLYEEIHSGANEADMHGAAVASIALGNTVGVAPKSDLYFIACSSGEHPEGEILYDLLYLAKAIDRVCEINKKLPVDKKIRVISISLGINKDMKNYKLVMKSIKNAEKQNIHTVYVCSERYMGMYRKPDLDPDETQSYGLGLFWENRYFAPGGEERYSNTVMIPMDSRTTASPTGINDYVFYAHGGLSWTAPYMAGLYALACQVSPDISFKDFWRLLNETGSTIRASSKGREYDFGRIANPERLIRALTALKGSEG